MPTNKINDLHHDLPPAYKVTNMDERDAYRESNDRLADMVSKKNAEIERLKAERDQAPGLPWRLEQDLRAEIERLRADIAVKARFEDDCEKLRTTIGDMRAEIERLGGLLEAKTTPGYELLATTIENRDAEIERLQSCLHAQESVPALYAEIERLRTAMRAITETHNKGMCCNDRVAALEIARAALMAPA